MTYNINENDTFRYLYIPFTLLQLKILNKILNSGFIILKIFN